MTTLTGHSNSVTSLAFSADGKFLVSGGEDNLIKIWQVSQ
jgi:WD40 repeat protein